MLEDPGLQRVTIRRLDENAYKLLWSVHHVILDGWSGAMLITQIMSDYHQSIESKVPPVLLSPSLSHYHQYRKLHEFSSRNQLFWKRYLKDFSQPTLLEGEKNDQSEFYSNHIKISAL